MGVSSSRVWAHAGAHGALRQRFLAAVQGANVAYQGQFPNGANTLGAFGSGHNKATGAQRVQATLLQRIEQGTSCCRGAERRADSRRVVDVDDPQPAR